jgi:hypothetical protein
MRGPEGLSIFSSSGSRSITTGELSSLTGHMPRYYALLGATAECELLSGVSLAGPAILRLLRQCVYFVYLPLILAGQSQI